MINNFKIIGNNLKFHLNYMYVYVFVLNKLSRLEAYTHTSFFYFK